MNADLDIAVVGGGASGMAAALAAKAAGPGLSIAVLERQARVGRKLLATGNGRCNLTHLEAGSLRHYHGGVFLARPALHRFGPAPVRGFFQGLGLETIADEAGRVYPLSDQAASVVDVLRLSLVERKVEVLTAFEVKALERGFVLTAQDGRRLSARRVVVCCGGPAGEKLGGTRSGHLLLGALGHPLTRVYPALCQLKTPPEAVRALKGIKYRGPLALMEDGRPVQREEGEVLFTDYGLTGIAAMALCRRAAAGLAGGRRMEARLTPCALDAAALAARRDNLPDRALDDFLTGIVPKRLGQQLIKLCGAAPLARPASSLSGEEIAALAKLLNGWTIPILGTQPLESAQVTAGGADCAHFDPDTLQSKRINGLFAAGEVLDIDGDCGGFNLQWAWASGLLAGESAARSLA